ncbi:BolA-like protein 1 [Thelohanellus kitauei]|uniref:BolA-like protein 1 n=1 Tax=Thelohanellus kitauei TaxID=669202 RepID=A0A0C2J088_THEKT|nr:BolA-like protein 1 [Thelohanellus kitauei]
MLSSQVVGYFQMNGPIRSQIINKLTQSLQPAFINVINESPNHGNGTAESHFRILVTSEKFRGLLRIERHRLIYQILEQEMKMIHAISIEAKVPTDSELQQGSSPPCVGGHKK